VSSATASASSFGKSMLRKIKRVPTPAKAAAKAMAAGGAHLLK
jgi:hypothetical protein